METGFYVDLDYEDASANVHFHDLLNAHFEKYVAGKELSKSNVKHIQCWCCHSSDKTAYNKFIAKVKKRWKLTGRATENQRKQYGRIRGVVRNTDNLISYCLKDGNYVTKGLEETYVEERYATSYQKEDDEKAKWDKFIEECKMRIFKMPDDQKFAPTKFEEYQERLENAVLISEIWYKHYETVIPNSVTDKALLVLGLITHTDIAKQRFRSYIGCDPSKDYY